MKNTHINGKNAKLVAQNPVARAFAHKSLSAASTETKARIVVIEDGEVDQKSIQSTARFITVVLMAAEGDKLQKRDDFNFQELLLVLDKGLQHLVAMSNNGFKWDYSKALDVVDAIDAGVLLTPKLSATAINEAWRKTR